MPTMRQLYTVCFYLALPFILLRLFWRARTQPHYLKNWRERLGYLSKSVPKKAIWIHAVSMGETIAATPLIKALQQRHPEIPILVTTGTMTGSERAHTALGDKVTHLQFPYDLPATIQRFLAATQPRCLILIETELWPNLQHYCGQHNIPVMLANARLSERSVNGYRRINRLTCEMLANISLLAVQTQVEADRFIQLGIDPSHIHVTGSIKFDLEIPADLITRATQLRQEWGKERLIWIAASTHETEEEIILEAYKKVQQQLPNILLVLVPRHPERFTRVANLCKKQGYSIILRSEKQPCNAATQIFIGDTMGELLLFYGASDIAFVGGSLVATGGHNPLEPAALGLPVIMGPHLFNFAAISQQLQNVDAMLVIHNTEELATQVNEILQNKSRLQQMGENGKKFVAQNRGALQKHVELIETRLIKPTS